MVIAILFYLHIPLAQNYNSYQSAKSFQLNLANN